MSILKTVPLIAFVLLATFCNAQDRIREGGLSFSNFDRFGLVYRTGKPEALWRFNTLAVNANHRDQDFADRKISQKSAGLSISAGREFRKEVAEKFQIRYGFDLSFSFNRMKIETTFDSSPDLPTIEKVTTWGPSVGGVLGMNYVIGDKLVIGAEILPALWASRHKHISSFDDSETKSETTQFGFDLSSSSLLLTMVLRF